MEPTADFRGARGSNAGDQFHELWALEQVLALLDATNQLSAVTVEGVASESSGTTGEGPHWDGVDCALYFGGETLETARRVEFVQLKYSSDPGRAWSIARLTESSAKTTNNSVLRRLADHFVDARKHMQPDAELRLRLVSNQPLAPVAGSVLQAGAGGGPAPDELRQHLDLIAETTGLAGVELSRFLSSLDVSNCGTASRFAQRERVILAIAQLIEGNATSDAAELQQRIRELMLPERHRERATFQTVLSWFGIADRTALFPCPQETIAVERPILREAAKQVTESIMQGTRLACLHGPAGCGKTTAIKQVGALLPQGSCFVLFDCFGGGSYLFPDDRRHLPENAFLQIVNDLAITLKTPLFLPRGRRQPIDVRRFLKRVADCAAVVAAAQPEALVVLGIDAADNAVTAAGRESPSAPCFVHELCSANLESLPGNVRVVISARTARVDGLRLPRNAVKVPCPPFAESETAQYVRGYWPKSTDAWIEQFHQLSNGVPRVQNYAVEAAAGDQEIALDALRPGGKRLNDILHKQFEQALKKSGEEPLFSSLVGGLATLAPPIPAQHLAAIARASIHVIEDLVNDLSPGLRVGKDGIFIADEDFEDFIKAEAESKITSIRPIVAEHLLLHHRIDAYAATHVADALVAANRGTDLLPLIEDENTLEAVSDPIVKREIQLRRLRLALTACRSAGDLADTLKVILVSADANKDEAALRDVLERNTDLAVHFAWPTLRRLVLADRDSVEDQGSVLAQDAARAAWAADRFTARERLVSYEAWLDRRRKVDPKQLQHWKISDDDITARAEAIFELAGPEAVIDELKRWKPRTVPVRVALRLVSSLIARGHQRSVADSLDRGLVPEPWNLLLSVPLALAGCTVDVTAIAGSLAKIERRHVPDLSKVYWSGEDRWEQQIVDMFVTACELGVYLGVERPIVISAVGILDDGQQSHLTTSQPVAIDTKIRLWLLEQHLSGRDASLDALLEAVSPTPAKAEEPPRKPVRRDDRDEELRSAVRALFPVYVGRLKLITCGGVPVADESAAKELIPGVDSTASSFDYQYWSRGLRSRAALSIMNLMVLQELSPRVLFQRAVAVLEGRHRDPFRSNLIPLLQCLIVRQEEHQAVLKMVVTATEGVRQTRSSSSEKVDSFISFSRLLLRISPKDAEALFASAISLTKEIDREAFDQIQMLSCLANSSSSLTIDDRRRAAVDVYRFVTGSAERLSGYDHFPWSAAMVALARLSVPVALASLARWADAGTISLQTTIEPLLREALALGELTPAVAVALAILLEVPDGDLAKCVLKAAEGSGMTLSLGEELARDCMLHAPQADRLALGREILGLVRDEEVASSHDLSLLRRTVEFLESLPAEPNRQERSAVKPVGSLENSTAGGDKTIDLSGRRFITAQAMREVLDLPREPDRFVHEQELLTAMRRMTTLADRVSFLNALAEVNLSPLSESSRARTLRDALEAWADSPAVSRWRAEQLPHLIVRQFAGLARELKWGDPSLPELLALSGIAAGDRLRVLTEGIEQSGLSLGSGALHGVAELIVKDAPRPVVAGVLTWYVARLGARVPVEPARLFDLDHIPTSTIAAAGRFLFALLSDIDTRVRWRAAHALRRLARLGAADTLNAVVANWNRTEDRSFREPDAPFYWLAARLWLVMTLECIGEETPQAVLPHLPVLASITVDPNLPHVLIREYAKRALLHLGPQSQTHLGGIDLLRIESVNKSRLKRVAPAKGMEWRSIAWQDTSHRTFQFGSMDTVIYWYSDVLRMFPRVDKDLILDMAECWILEKWGAPTDANWWSNEPRKGRYDERRYGLWYPHHGGLPTIERFGAYLEWHAMFCTVGELLETHALSHPTDRFEGFEAWLGESLPTEPNHWMSDARQPTPLETRMWAPDPRDDMAWLRAVRSSDFLEELGLGKGAGSDRVVVAGRFNVKLPTRELTVSISSALVSSETASALARALQTVRNPFDFGIPPEGDSRAIDEAPYRLMGWLTETSRDTRFDERDPLRHDTYPLPETPGRAARKALRLKRLHGACPRWSAGEEGHPSFVGEMWSDFPQREDPDRLSSTTGSSGWRLWTQVSQLQTFLQETAFDLICAVKVERRTHTEYERSYDPDPKKRKTFHKIVLLRRDGQIEGPRGRLGSWATPRRGAQA